MKKTMPRYLTILLAAVLFSAGCGGYQYSQKGGGTLKDSAPKEGPIPSASSERIDKFNKTYVCCKAREEFKNEGYRPDFRKTYFIQEGKELVNTMFAPLSDTSKNLLMLKVVGDNATFPLSVTYMEQTAYMTRIVATMQRYYHFTEDSAVTIVASYNGKRLTQCPVLSLRSSHYIAKTLLKNVLTEEDF